MAMVYRNGRLSFVIIVMSILLSGCGKHGVQNSETVQDSEAIISSEDVTYEGSDILLQGIEGEIQQCSIKDDMLYILACKQEETHLYKAMIDGSDLVEIPVSLENANIGSFYVDEVGDIFCLTSAKESGDITGLVRLNAEGKEVVRTDLQEMLPLTGENLLNRITVDGLENIIIASESAIYCLDSELQSVDKINSKEHDEIINFIRTKSGKLACVVGERDQDGDIDGKVCILDTEKREWGSFLRMAHHPMIDEYCLMEGQEYEFYYKDGAGVFGYNSEGETTWTKVLDARCSLLTTQDIRGMIGEEKGQFWGMLNDSEDSADGLVLELYSKFNPDKPDNRKIITYAGYNVTNQLRQAARKFNKTHKDCKVNIQIYEDEDHTRLALDIATGKVPDIFSISSVGIPMEKWVRKGILEDLTPYYENDKEIDMDDIVPSVLKGMKKGDKLYCVTPYFSIWSAACRISDAEGNEGWNFEEMKEAFGKKGEGAIAFDSLEKEEMFLNLFISSEEDFINWETGECNFDSREFKDILKFCNKGIITEQESDYEEMLEEIETKMKEGKVLLSVDQGIAINSIQVARQRFGSDITYIGLPAKDRHGSYFIFGEQYGIYSGSEVKDEAWEFIRMVMSEEYQVGAVLPYAAFFPTRKDCLTWKLQTQMATEPYEDEYGNMIEPLETASWYTASGDKIQIGPASQEDVDKMMDLIEKTEKQLILDEVEAQIIEEEVLEYFYGNRSLNKTVNIIQSRMTTYVNEQR